MGATSSHHGNKGHTAGGGGAGQQQKHQDHSAIPEDPVPYPGPKYEYRVTIVNSKLQANMTFFPSAGQQIAHSDIQSFYPHLQNQYAEFFKLNTFFQIPLAMKRSGAFSMSATIPFQGILSRPSVYVPSEEKWQLHIEQSAIQISVLRSGSLFTLGYPQIDEHLGDIFNKIAESSKKGGKFLCMECSGSVVSQGMTFTKSPFYGVDLFFDMPQHPNPQIYTYTAFSTPMNLQYGFGSIEIFCDWNGTLAQHLDQGWKLVDIFIAQQETGMLMQGNSGNNRHYRPTHLNTVWFFEKEVSLAQDMRPRYQVTFIEYYMPFSAGFGSVSSHLDLASLLSEMGSRGWELVAVVDTPQTRSSGFAKGTRGIVVFFQRPLIAGQPAGMVPPPMMNVPPPTSDVSAEASAIPTKEA